ncbi:MAG TPA: ABC transporter permease [Bryobacteraceae bacterium]|nr:ABC transporter permease [Bryobacteraceae bacterium]
MLRGLWFDWNFLDTMGVPVELGRNFLHSDRQPDRRVAMILSHSLWMRRFGGDPHVVGRVLRFSTGPVMVVGALPTWFQPLLKAQSTPVPEMYYPRPTSPLGLTQQ